MPTHKHHPELLRAVGARLKAAREARGLTQAALAQRIGIEPVTLSRYETGARGPSITTLALAARELGVSLAMLMDVGGDPIPEDPSELARAVAMLRTLNPDQRNLALGALEGMVRVTAESRVHPPMAASPSGADYSADED